MDKREELNQLGVEWHNTPWEGNEAVKTDLQERIFLLALELFCPGDEDNALGQFFLTDWSKFNAAKGDLFGFMSYRLKMRKRDMDRQDFDGTQVKEKDTDTGEEPHGKKRHTSLYNPVGEGGSTLGDTLPGDAGVDDSGMMIDELVLEVMTLMLDLKGRLGSRAGNPVRINYFRLFFTDGVVDAIHSQGTGAFARRERDLFHAIKETFLNYFMGSPCGCVKEILDTGLKCYGQMVEGRPMEPPGQPLPNDVYTTYLRQAEHYDATAQAVSQQRTAYRAFVRDQLRC